MRNEGISSLTEGIEDQTNCWNEYFIRMENEITPRRMTPCNPTGQRYLFRVKWGREFFMQMEQGFGP
jgi:hypothetical protein